MNKQKKVKAIDLVTWSQISRVLANNDNSVRKDKIPLCYKEDVDKLLEKVNDWIDEMGE